MKLKNLSFAFTLMALASGCKKEEQAAPVAPVQVAAPAAAPVVPGMETQNPAEKEGKQ